jgi:hypothetical protein
MERVCKEKNIINCPYCILEMEQGVIQSPQEIFWNREKSMENIVNFNKESILLTRLSFFKVR